MIYKGKEERRKVTSAKNANSLLRHKKGAVTRQPLRPSKKSVYRKHTKGKEIELWMFHL